MNEAFLRFVWRFGLFDKNRARTTDGEPLEFIDLGLTNNNAGPDFLNAKIKIGKIIWAGNVEIHINASDWKRHKHHLDKAYDNVILHVVQNADCELWRLDGTKIPVYKLEYKVAIEKRYDELLLSREWLPCQNYVKNIDNYRLKVFLGRFLIERLEQRSAHISEILLATKNDFNQVFYKLLFRAFGFGVNSLPFELLAQNILLVAVNKHKSSLLQIEALLFGQAGFLEGNSLDEYHAKLQMEYKFLQTKFDLKPIEKHLWKFLRLRPSNFPTIRISQLAHLLTQSNDLLDKITSLQKPEELIGCFSVKASEYWDTHYVFGKETKKKIKTLGKQSAEKMLINVVVPYLFAYGKTKDNKKYCNRAFDLLESIAPEKNSIIDGWENMGFKVDSAFYSQALIQMKEKYCDDKKCLQCNIGKDVIDT